MAQPDPLKEAADPATDPERLRQLARHQDLDVKRTAMRNPSLPEFLWRQAFLDGWPEAWANPMAPIYLLTWTPRENDEYTLEAAIRWAAQILWRNPERCSAEGKALIAAKIQEWWATSESAQDMMVFLGWWCTSDGNQSEKHREVVRITVLCVRTAPDLIAKDRKALDLLEAWTAGGKDYRKKAESLTSSNAVMDTVKFSQDSQHTPWNAMYEVLWAVNATAGEQVKAEHERLLADVIRREMPLPPVVV